MTWPISLRLALAAMLTLVLCVACSPGRVTASLTPAPAPPATASPSPSASPALERTGAIAYAQMLAHDMQEIGSAADLARASCAGPSQGCRGSMQMIQVTSASDLATLNAASVPDCARASHQLLEIALVGYLNGSQAALRAIASQSAPDFNAAATTLAQAGVQMNQANDAFQFSKCP